MTRLVDAGLVAEDWNQGENKGIVSSSVAVIATEAGNPLGIQDWDDLTRDDVKIVTPDPASSGSAKWNILALYTYAKSTGATEAQADAFLKKVFKNVSTWAASGREATEAFKKGVGNVLLTYENEAILAKQNGEDLDYIVPDHTFKIENPGAVLKDASPVATDWLDFILSDEGQTHLRRQGLPPGDRRRHHRCRGRRCQRPGQPVPGGPRTLSTAADLGGWSAINKEWFGKDGEKLRFDKLYAEATKRVTDTLVSPAGPAPSRGRPSGRGNGSGGRFRSPLPPASASAWRWCGSASWC